MKNVLLLSNLDAEMNDPYFREGAYKTYLQAIASSLRASREYDIRFLLNSHIFSSMRQSSAGTTISAESCFIVDPRQTLKAGLDGFMTRSYRETDKDELDRAARYLQEILGRWTPDVIICWEAPTKAFRIAYSNAVVLDIMPSIFARPPYPRAISIDPVGLYQDCWFSPNNLQQLSSTTQQRTLVDDLRQFYLDHFRDLNAKASFSKMLSLPRDGALALAPLQISEYFGFRDNCEFSNQFEFLEKVARSAPEDVIICTQYVGGFVSERALTERNLAYLRENVADVRYSQQFEVIDSVSQYVIPWVDTVYSVSSTLGLQAKFLGKRLVSPSTSHLQYIADKVSLNGSDADHQPFDTDAFFGNYLTRGVMLFETIINEPDYISKLILDMFDRKRSGATGVDVLPDESVVGNTYEKYVALSKFAPSERNFRKLFPSARSMHAAPIPTEAQTAIASDQIKVVSFDIFDTLVRRTVYKPEDVFSIIQERLRRHHSDAFPEHFVLKFAELRQATERLVRQKRDALLAQPNSSANEEITIGDVYAQMVSSLGVPGLDIGKLIQIEQEVEFSVLRPRRIGKLMYEYAKAFGKRIVVTSDFIHDDAFIREVLRRCGYEDYEALFLSSSFGSKKHSGDLFKEVIAATQVAPDAILHIGDNPVGDLQRAREQSIRAVMVPSGRALAKESLLARNVNQVVFDRSFYLRTILGLFANTYLNGNHPRQIAAEIGDQEPKFKTISTREEFGFLVLGPMALSFSEWIINQALSRGVRQIIFFARDCYLPFKMCEDICRARGLPLNLVYAPTSRKSVTGLDMFKAEDVLKVRIDDFTAGGTLERLFAERFLIFKEDVSPALMTKWGVDGLHLQKRTVQPAAIYGLALDIAREKWDLLGHRYHSRRTIFRNYLSGTSEIDFDKPSLAVDFGYQGSIHKKFEGLFTSTVTPLFFMTYHDGFGRAPLEQAAAFYAENCNPSARANVCVTHNLLLETLMNEAKGSVLDIVELADGSHQVVRDSSITAGHAVTINDIHRGALKLCREWLDECAPIHEIGIPDPDSVSFFFSMVMKTPTLTDIALLSELSFDNGYAGVANQSLVAIKNGKQTTEKVLWPEALSVAKKHFAATQQQKPDAQKQKPAAQKPATPQQKPAAQPKYPVPVVRRPLVPIVRPLVRMLGSKKDLSKYDQDPVAFFANLKSRKYRLAGRILFPQAVKKAS